jgi:DNA replication and repair protein RecF
VHISSLKLDNFRNYKSAFIEFGTGFNLIYGDNAQGKTNIIEAVQLCSTGRSHLMAKDQELVRIGESGYYVRLMFEREKLGASSVEIGYSCGGRKNIRINDAKAAKAGELFGNFNSVIFSPEDLYIIKEGPSLRRRYIDIALSQYKPSYFHELQLYSRIITQRNALLCDARENPQVVEMLDIWDDNLIKTGTRIISNRLEYMEHLCRNASKKHEQVSGAGEDLTLGYIFSFDTAGDISAAGIRDAFSDSVKRLKKREIACGATLAGPHRDDFSFSSGGMNLKQFGSQGQQRTAVICLKLAEIDMITQEKGEPPVLLLDDVMSELDKDRQQHLMASLENIQTIVTGTEISMYDHAEGKSVSYMEIKNGQIISS